MVTYWETNFTDSQANDFGNLGKNNSGNILVGNHAVILTEIIPPEFYSAGNVCVGNGFREINRESVSFSVPRGTQGLDKFHSGSHHSWAKINGSFRNVLMGSSSMAWIIDQWAWGHMSWSSHGLGHLFRVTWWGVNNVVTQVMMGSPIPRELANVQNSFSLKVSEAPKCSSALAPPVSEEQKNHQTPKYTKKFFKGLSRGFQRILFMCFGSSPKEDGPAKKLLLTPAQSRDDPLQCFCLVDFFLSRIFGNFAGLIASFQKLFTDIIVHVTVQWTQCNADRKSRHGFTNVGKLRRGAGAACNLKHSQPTETSHLCLSTWAQVFTNVRKEPLVLLVLLNLPEPASIPYVKIPLQPRADNLAKNEHITCCQNCNF